MSFRFPRWLRLVAFLLVLGLTLGLGFKGAQEVVKPVTLTVAAGSLDGEVVRVMTAISSRLASTGAKVRINIVDKGSPVAAAEAFARGETQLAVVRGDNEELGAARTVVQLANLVLIALVPPNSPVKSVGDFKGRTVAVVGLESNQRLLATLVKVYGFPPNSVQFVDMPIGALAEAARNRKAQAAIVVAPLGERYIGLLRSFFSASGKMQAKLLEIDAADAIVLESKQYESFELPKGALRGAPPLPEDTLSTIRVPLYLVADRKVGEDTIATLAKALMDVRRELSTESPMLAQIAAPDDDKNAAIPIHPGAKAFFDGSEKTFSDKYGDWLFYGPIILGMVGSFLAGLWKFLTGDGGKRSTDFSQRLTLLLERVRAATTQDELDAVDRETDELLTEYLKAQSGGQIDGDQIGAMNTIISHLENAIDRRSRALRQAMAAKPA